MLVFSVKLDINSRVSQTYSKMLSFQLTYTDWCLFSCNSSCIFQFSQAACFRGAVQQGDRGVGVRLRWGGERRPGQRRGQHAQGLGDPGVRDQPPDSAGQWGRHHQVRTVCVEWVTEATLLTLVSCWNCLWLYLEINMHDESFWPPKMYKSKSLLLKTFSDRIFQHSSDIAIVVTFSSNPLWT